MPNDDRTARGCRVKMCACLYEFYEPQIVARFFPASYSVTSRGFNISRGKKNRQCGRFHYSQKQAVKIRSGLVIVRPMPEVDHLEHLSLTPFYVADENYRHYNRRYLSIIKIFKTSISSLNRILNNLIFNFDTQHLLTNNSNIKNSAVMCKELKFYSDDVTRLIIPFEIFGRGWHLRVEGSP